MAGRATSEQKIRHKPTRSGVLLDKALIVDTALRLLQEHGREGLSMRRLGRALGADHTAVYRYFADRNALELAITDAMIQQATSTWDRRGNWDEDLIRWGLEGHVAHTANPAATQISAARISGGEPELAGVESIMRLLSDAGFPPDYAVMFYEMFISQLLAYSLWDGSKKQVPEQGRQEDIARWKKTYAMLSAEGFPAISSHSSQISRLTGLDAYPRVLRVLVMSMKATLAELQQ